MTGVTSWRRFELRLASTFVLVTIAALALAGVIVLSLARFLEQEWRYAAYVLLPLLSFSPVVQQLLHRRWLRATKKWLARPEPDREQMGRVYLELMRFPFRGSSLSFCFWIGGVLLLVGSRLLLLPDVPMYRNVLLLSAAGAAGLLSLTLQYFLFRRTCVRILNHVDVDADVLTRVQRQPLMRKYTLLFAYILFGVVVFSCTIAYGLNRSSLLQAEHRRARDLLLMVERLVYDYEFPGAFDVQSKLDQVNARVNGSFRIVAKPSPNAIHLADLFAETIWIAGIIPITPVEVQRVGERLLLTQAIGGGNAYLEYEADTTPLLARLRSLFWRIMGLGAVLTALMVGTIYIFIFDVSRPIRLIRRVLHPTGESFVPPPLLIGDDELAHFSLGVRNMLIRLRALFQDLLQAYWDVKDERDSLQTIALRFQQRTQRDGQQIQMVAGKLRNLIDQVQGLGQQLEAMAKVSESISQAIRLMTDAIGSIHGEVGQIRQRVREAREWLQSTHDDLDATNRAMSGLGRWISEAVFDFDSIQKKFADLVEALGPIDARLVEFDQRVRSGTEYVLTACQLLGNEAEHYNQGVELIEQAQDRLDEVMLQFQEVESIREQIDMLSFQAAVVAAHTPDFERDFRVVADEIRDLSERAAVGIQRIYSAIYVLDQQGKQTLERILNSRFAMGEALDVSRRAHSVASKVQALSGDFTGEMHKVVEVIREESVRTARLVESLREPFTRGMRLRTHIDQMATAFAQVRERVERLDEISRHMEVQIVEQQDGLRAGVRAISRTALGIRDLISSGEGMITQSRTLRSILERLVAESRQTSERIVQTLADLGAIEAEIFRNEAEVKRISAEVQSA